jgi:hypothetical protein
MKYLKIEETIGYRILETMVERALAVRFWAKSLCLTMKKEVFLNRTKHNSESINYNGKSINYNSKRINVVVSASTG